MGQARRAYNVYSTLLSSVAVTSLAATTSAFIHTGTAPVRVGCPMQSLRQASLSLHGGGEEHVDEEEGANTVDGRVPDAVRYSERTEHT